MCLEFLHISSYNSENPPYNSVRDLLENQMPAPPSSLFSECHALFVCHTGDDNQDRQEDPYRYKDIYHIPLSLRRALKNYRYFHFIGVVRRHYRAFTRRSGYDVW